MIHTYYLSKAHALMVLIIVLAVPALYYISYLIVSVMYWWTFKRKKADNNKLKSKTK